MVEEWKEIIARSITKPEQILSKFKVDTQSLKLVAAEYPMRVSQYYFDLIEEVDDPIWRQCIPSPLELQDPFGVEDPLSEEEMSPVPGLVHRYPDRVLMCVSNICATYCRFCTRKRKVGKPVDYLFDSALLNQIQYVKATPVVRDALLSGGDPFMLSDERIEFLLKKLRAIPHLEILRIGTRIPCTLPQRITSKLCNMLKKYHPLYVNVHFNHPREITEESERACGLLADAGIPLGNQSVLLRGVNDEPDVMKNLVHKLLKARIKPYYLYQADLVKGTYHFRTRVETGIKIIGSLIGFTSGLAVPRFVIDSPDYLISIGEDKVVMRNYEGKIHTYAQIPSTEENLEQKVTFKTREIK